MPDALMPRSCTIPVSFIATPVLLDSNDCGFDYVWTDVSANRKGTPPNASEMDTGIPIKVEFAIFLYCPPCQNT